MLLTTNVLNSIAYRGLIASASLSMAISVGKMQINNIEAQHIIEIIERIASRGAINTAKRTKGTARSF